MSKIRLTPNASGTGTVTLTVPSTSTDRTLTLPDKSGTLVDTSENPFLAYDSWYLTADDTTAGQHQIDGWTRATTSNITQIGSAMSESNSYWTFPTTGYWLITWAPFFICNNNDQIQSWIRFTTDDNSTYSDVGNLVATGENGNRMSQYLFDVEDTSTHKFRFIADSIGSGSRIYGGAIGRTSAKFMKMGET